MDEQKENGTPAAIEIGKNVLDAIGKGVEKIRKRSKGRKNNRSFLGAIQTSVLLQIFAAAVVVMGFFCFGFFGVIAKAASPFSSEITFKGWVYSFSTGLALGGILSAWAETLKMLIRIVKNLESRDDKEDGALQQ